MNDLVSYDKKHNESNNEGNRDGHNENLSWNCGIEGPSDDPKIESIRLKQIKNFFTTNILALGVPMLVMGMKSVAHKTATTTLIARTMKSVGSIGNLWKRMRTCTVLYVV